METKSKLNVVSIKEFAAANSFIQIAPAVRENVNGYAYLTFINKDNVAENVYFSKAAGEKVTAGTAINGTMLASLRIAYTTNAGGEKRTKLIGAGERLELSDLLG